MFLIYILSLLSGILSGTTESLNKNITEQKFSSFSYAFIQLCGNSLIYAIPFFLYGSISNYWPSYLYFLALIVVVNAGNLLIIRSYKTEDISNINILSQSSLIVGFTSGIFLLHEMVNLAKITGVFLILLGIITLFYRKQHLKMTSGFIFAILSGVFFGLAPILNKKILQYFNVITLLFIINASSTLFYLISPKNIRDVIPVWKKYKWKIILSRITAAIAFFLYIFSLQKGDISVIYTNYETAFILSTAFIGIVIFKEKTNLAKKLLGATLCSAGIILLNFF